MVSSGILYKASGNRQMKRPQTEDTASIAKRRRPQAVLSPTDEERKLRQLTYGTSQFLVSLGMTCKLTFRGILLGLRLLHRATVYLPLVRCDRKAVSAACLALAWKHMEDREGFRQSRKIRTLARGIYILSTQSSQSGTACALHAFLPSLQTTTPQPMLLSHPPRLLAFLRLLKITSMSRRRSASCAVGHPRWRRGMGTFM